tara:strand:+ start:185 stop:490 length:306 start_codon:yes stop_codon:yes gene_type:complete
MEKAYTETKTRTPEEKLQIAIIQQNMEDAFALSMSTNISQAEIDTARRWFYTKRCEEVCDHIGTSREHIQRLYEKLRDKYKTGQIDAVKLRFAIRKLEWKL